MAELTLGRVQVWEVVEQGYVNVGRITHGVFTSEAEAWALHDLLRRQRADLAGPGVLGVSSRYVEVAGAAHSPPDRREDAPRREGLRGQGDGRGAAMTTMETGSGLSFGTPLPLEVKTTAGDGAWEVAGYASVFGVTDLGNDVVTRGAFAQSLRTGEPVRFLYSHDPRQVLGTTLSLVEDDHGLRGRWRISKTQPGGGRPHPPAGRGAGLPSPSGSSPRTGPPTRRAAPDTSSSWTWSR